MKPQLTNLLEEIERQRSLCQDVATGSNSSPLQNLSYGQKLSDLGNALVDRPGDSDWQRVNLRDVDLIWEIPARCSIQHRFYPPKELKKQCQAIQNARDMRSAPGNSTDNTWIDPQLHQWASAKEPSLLLVEGKGTASKCIERFGLEMIEYLEAEGQSPVYFPNIIRLDDAGQDMQLGAPGLLRQLAIQALLKVPPTDAMELLAASIGEFRTASSCEAWFTTLSHICRYVKGQIYFVVDLGVLRGEASEIHLWPSEISTFFNRLKADSHPVLAKFILLNYRDASLLSASDELGRYLVRIKPQGPLSPIAMKMLLKQRREEDVKRQTGKIVRPLLYGPQVQEISSEPAENKSHEGRIAQEKTPQERIALVHTPITEISPPRNRESIRIVVICALTLEADAVQALFDKHWDDAGLPFDRAPGDKNTYSVGAIGNHDILLLHIPGMGKVQAARAAVACQASFINIQLALLVGVCGGVPFGVGGEVVLGDVVISDGIVQYDLGTQLPGNFQRKNTLVDNLGRPNTEIRGLLSKLKGLRGREMLGRQMANDLELLQRNPDLSAVYPGTDRDILFDPTYNHMDEGTCEQVGCSGLLVSRNRLLQKEPERIVHFGLIASGDKVIRSAEERDNIARTEGVIGFEMEGAGIWDTFPCVVIKGVCDYADSHKSKTWQRYAAATAAACMKGFLINVPR